MFVIWQEELCLQTAAHLSSPFEVTWMISEAGRTANDCLALLPLLPTPLFTCSSLSSVAHIKIKLYFRLCHSQLLSFFTEDVMEISRAETKPFRCALNALLSTSEPLGPVFSLQRCLSYSDVLFYCMFFICITTFNEIYNWSDCLHNVGSLTSHNPIGLHGLLRG
jgi:hypothetical protein